MQIQKARTILKRKNFYHHMKHVFKIKSLAIYSFSLLILVACINAPVSLAPTQKTSTGIVTAVQKDQILNWIDIPFALPPVGELRWKAPRSFQAPGQRISPQTDNGCLQEPSIYAGIQGDGIVGQEDCLYLDIQTPIENLSKNLPVMFWIHGGGNTTGIKDYYDFSELIKRHEVVIVKINYRLGPMGWFTHPAIQGLQEGMDQTSNFGTLDIIEALKWVQANIHLFGGDPDNVTIFGESAGGHNVLSLLASPASHGIFHKAISQSGYTVSATQEEALGIDSNGNIANALGSDPVLNSLDTVGYNLIKQLYLQDPVKHSQAYQSYLRSLDGKALLAMYRDISKETLSQMPLATRDGLVIPINGIAEGLGDPTHSKNIPVIAGSNKDELSLWLGANRYFVDAYYPLTKLIPIPKVSLRREGLYRLWVQTRSQGWKLRGVDQPLMQLESTGNKSLYAYQFDWDDQVKSYFADFPDVIGAAHGFEISFVTGDFKFGPIGRYVYPKGELRDQMQATMMRAWTSFSKTGVPDAGQSLTWIPFTKTDRSFIHLDKDTELRLEKDKSSIDSILASVSNSSVGSDVEKCLLAHETLFNIGDPLPKYFMNWEQGKCNQFNVDDERKRIKREVIAEFGSASIYD